MNKINLVKVPTSKICTLDFKYSRFQAWNRLLSPNLSFDGSYHLPVTADWKKKIKAQKILKGKHVTVSNNISKRKHD